MVLSKTEEEKELESAIKSLLAALPKETRNCILQLKLPSFANNDEGKIAHDLGIAIDNLIKAQNEQKLNCAGMDRAKDYIVKFYKLTYPFAKMILNFAEQVAFSRFVRLTYLEDASLWNDIRWTSLPYAGYPV